jgi:lipopolysaccharide transport system ATP-binding protein
MDFQRSRRREYLWAVQGLSFRLERGQSLGIIGRNGSGKSSLLKVLSGVLAPDQGRVRCRGRVSALLELGTGFHPELTGTENILLYGAMMGVPRAEMQRRAPRIAAFAEVENFIDIPVKNYSTGMYTRLAFSAAIDVEPDLLLVDEVLAVGDQAFQAKCYQRIEQLKREGVSIVLVAHDLGLVERYCEQALRLEGGRAKGYGPAGT